MEVVNDRAPLPLIGDPVVILHVIPLGAFLGSGSINLDGFFKKCRAQTITSEAASKRMTFNGVLFYEQPINENRSSGYAHFSRNGIVEAAAIYLIDFSMEELTIPYVRFETKVSDYLPCVFESLNTLEVYPPVALCLTLGNVKGLRMANDRSGFRPGVPIREEHLLIPAALIEDFRQPIDGIVKPLFDQIWNACGLDGSVSFD